MSFTFCPKREKTSTLVRGVVESIIKISETGFGYKVIDFAKSSSFKPNAAQSVE